MGKFDWFMNLVWLALSGVFAQFVLIPFFAPHIIGTPASWVFTGVVVVVLYVIRSFFLWRRRREILRES
jgi:dolichyl-phosphate-mannose--protein O-mannosyl transferase